MDNEIARIVMTAGAEAANVRRVTLQAQDVNGNPVRRIFHARVKVSDDGDFDGTATNATIAAVSESSTVEWTHTSTKDLSLVSVSGGGEMDVDITDATAETVTVFQGPPPFGGCGADQSQSLDLVFA